MDQSGTRGRDLSLEARSPLAQRVYLLAFSTDFFYLAGAEPLKTKHQRCLPWNRVEQASAGAAWSAPDRTLANGAGWNRLNQSCLARERAGLRAALQASMLFIIEQ